MSADGDGAGPWTRQPAPEAATSPATASAPPPGVWRNHDWLRLWSGSAATTLGSSMVTVALPLLSYALTRSVRTASVVTSLETLAFLLAGPVAGLVVDRVDRRRVMVVADLVGLLAYVGLAACLRLGVGGVRPLLVAVVVTGARQSFSTAAHSAAVRRVVGARDVAVALSHQQAASAGAEMLGPPAGGMVYALGRYAPFLVLAGTFLLDLALVLRIRTDLAVERVERVVHESMRARVRSLGADLTEGFRFMWRRASLRAVLGFAVLMNLATSIFYVALNLRLVSHGVRPVLIGTVDASSAAGILVGSLGAGWVVQRVPLGRLVWAAGVVVAVSWVPLALTGTAIAPTCALAFVAPLGIPAANATIMAYAQLVTPDALQGRVLTAASVMSMAAQPLGPLVAGFLLSTWGPGAAGLTAACVGAGVSLWLARDRELRSLGTPDTWHTDAAAP